MTPITHHLSQRLASPASDPTSCRVLHKSLRALNAILKELSHIKMMTSVKTLGQVCNRLARHFPTTEVTCFYQLIARIHSPLSEIYVQLIQRLGPSISIPNLSSRRTAEDLLFAHLLYKIIMKMAVWIWPKLRDPTISPMEPWVGAFIPDLCSASVDLLSFMKCSGILLLSFVVSTRLVLAFSWICVQLRRRLILSQCVL
jgi:hypothetical protein